MSFKEILIAQMMVTIVERIHVHVPDKNPREIEKILNAISHKDEEIIEFLHDSMIHKENSIEDLYLLSRQYISDEDIVKIFDESGGLRTRDQMILELYCIPDWLLKPFVAIFFMAEEKLPHFESKFAREQQVLPGSIGVPESEDLYHLSDKEVETLISKPGNVSVHLWFSSLRGSFGMTQLDVCKKWPNGSGKHPSFISAYERGHLHLSKENVKTLLWIFDKTEEDLYEATGKVLSDFELELNNGYSLLNTGQATSAEGIWLYNLRLNQKKSQKALAEELSQATGLEISQPMISLVERGKAALNEQCVHFLRSKYETEEMDNLTGRKVS